jgi:hypothetical protein
MEMMRPIWSNCSAWNAGGWRVRWLASSMRDKPDEGQASWMVSPTSGESGGHAAGSPEIGTFGDDGYEPVRPAPRAACDCQRHPVLVIL